MKIFTEKGILKKLLLILIAIIVFNAVIPSNVSYAAESSVGGVLLKPIADLMLAMGDFAMDLLHNVFYGMDTSVLRVDKDLGIWEFLAIAAAVIAAIAVIALAGYGLLAAGSAIVTALSAGAVTTTISAAAIGTIIFTAAGGGAAAGIFVRSEFFANEYPLPMYRITPEEIFTGKIRLLNINFFNEPEVTDDDIDTTVAIQNAQEVDSKSYFYTAVSGIKTGGTDPEEVKIGINQFLDSHGYAGEDVSTDTSITKRWSKDEAAYEAKITVITSEITADATMIVTTNKNWEVKIYKGDWIGTEVNTLGMQLRPTIAKWYYAIRNFTLVAMMLILLYIGIRIMICGVSSEKAKYKNMLMDWIVAICLIFVMHYIMAFSMNIVDGIIKIFASVNDDQEYIVDYEYDQKIIDELNKVGVDTGGLVTTNASGQKVIVWDAQNIVGLARVNAGANNSGSYVYLGWTMCYLVLVCYTIFFIFTYLKRALYITFFTIMAPLVAMTYPIDKIHDGKAQAFDMWIKEYIFNLMIQPVHLLLYTVLISSAFELASTNIIYMLVAIGFMMPAEKFLRKMFGFDKAQTPGFLSGATGTALMVTAFSKLFNKKPSKGGGSIGDGSGSSDGGKTKVSDQKHIDMTDGSSLFKESGGDPQKKVKGGSPILHGPEEEKKNRMAELMNQQRNSIDLSGGRDFNISRALREGKPIQGKTIPKPIISDSVKAKSSKAIMDAKAAKRKSWIAKHSNAIGAASKEWGRQKLNRASNDIANGKPIKDLAKFAGGAYGALVGGTLATTFSLSDDTPIKSMQKNVPTLAIAGAALGSREIKPNYDTESVYDEYQRALYDTEEEYQKALMEKETKKVIENEKNLKKVRDNLGAEYGITDLKEAKEFMERHHRFIDSGYTDMDDFCTMAKLVEDGRMDETMAATTAKYYKKAGGKPKNMAADSKELKNIKHICTNIAKSNGMTEQKDIDNAVNIMLKNIDLYGDTKDSFSQI